jgi:hypothetical protein
VGKVLLVVLALGAIVYFLIWTFERRRAVRRSTNHPSFGGNWSRPPKHPMSHPVAPDDDLEFLWKLDQEQRRRQREENPDA